VQALARVYRGTEVESIHAGSVAVVDAEGRLLAYAGDPGHRACLRSAAKPFQGIPLLEYGGADEYELTGEEIALTCASHGGQPFHVTTAASLLRKGEFDETDLLCGSHMPFDERSASELRASGEPASPLHNNCSGKHAGMLLATQVMDALPSRYIDADHLVQVVMRQTLADFAGTTPDDIPLAVDGCGVPAYYLSLHRAAFAYARLMASAVDEEAPGALARFADSAGRVVDAMTSFPEYVAGDWSMTTPLMTAFNGELLAKEGAEGFYAMALSPELVERLTPRLRRDDRNVPIGIALKIYDGSMTRGRNPVILRTLELLGLELDGRSELEPYRTWPLRNVAGKLVGEVRSEFELTFV
jgi:L-asparaginase II